MILYRHIGAVSYTHLHELRDMGLDCFEPYGAFYVFPSIKKFGLTSEEFATRLLEEEKVAVVPGTAFGDCGEGFLRISYASVSYTHLDVYKRQGVCNEA